MTDRNPTVPETPSSDLTVFYDGGCPMCRAEIGVYRTCDGAERIAFVDVSSTPASSTPAGEVTPGLSRMDALRRFHVQRADGTLVSGASGFAQLWLALPGWRWLGRIVMLPVVKPLAEGAYRVFLVFRPGLQLLWRTIVDLKRGR